MTREELETLISHVLCGECSAASPCPRNPCGWQESASDVIDAITAANCAVVPVEATEGMRNAYFDIAGMETETADQILQREYAAMLAAGRIDKVQP